jgi:hypothetical protein
MISDDKQGDAKLIGKTLQRWQAMAGKLNEPPDEFRESSTIRRSAGIPTGRYRIATSRV